MQSSTHRPGLGPHRTEVAPEPDRSHPDGSPLDLPRFARPDVASAAVAPAGVTPADVALGADPLRAVPLRVVPADPGSSPPDLSELAAARFTWPMDRQAAATLPAEAESVALARRFVRITAAAWRLRPETLADAELCMSELVGNAVRHTASRRLHCRLWSARGLLFVEVDDEDEHDIPCVELPDEDDECGRGMLLIDTFATAWGTIPRPGHDGKTVWAAFPLPP